MTKEELIEAIRALRAQGDARREANRAGSEGRGLGNPERREANRAEAEERRAANREEVNNSLGISEDDIQKTASIAIAHIISERYS